MKEQPCFFSFLFYPFQWGYEPILFPQKYRDTDKLLTLFSLLHLACVWILRIHNHDFMTLTDATNQHFPFPCCKQCPKIYHLQALQEPDQTSCSTKCFHTSFSASWPTFPLSQGWTAPWTAKKTSPRVPTCCQEAPSSRRCHKREWRFLHGRLVPFPLCLVSSIWQVKSKGSFWLGTCWWMCTHTEVTLQKCVHSHLHTSVHLCK